LSIFDVLEKIRANGFGIIEISSSYPHLDYHDLEMVRRAAERINQLGLEPFSFHAPLMPSIDITSLDRDQREKSVNEILTAAEAAGILGVQYFTIHPGPEKVGKPAAEEFLQRMKNAAQALTKVAQRCYDLGMILILENMLPHLLFGHISDLLWMMGAIGHRNIGICLDIGHANLTGDVATAMYRLSGHLRVIHANDNRGTADEHLPPGDGNIDWRDIIVKLQKVGFRGSFILELSGDSPFDVQHTLDGARKSRNLIWGLSRKIEFASISERS
jgi:sugar phosphate isomerase/epimerase